MRSQLTIIYWCAYISISAHAITGLTLGDDFPDFEPVTTVGRIRIHEWIGDNSWAILFSNPADYTPVGTTELGKIDQLMPEFEKRGVKVLALSCDTVESYNGWSQDIIAYSGSVGQLPYPIIADTTRDLAVKLGMIDPDEKDKAGLPLPCRAVFIVGPDKKLKLSILYPATTGINVYEIFRVIDSLQLTAYKKVATPANWKQGAECLIIPSVSKEDAKKLFPNHRVKKLPSGKEYLRFTPQPE